jgi:hypothetical protein
MLSLTGRLVWDAEIPGRPCLRTVGNVTGRTKTIRAKKNVNVKGVVSRYRIEFQSSGTTHRCVRHSQTCVSSLKGAREARATEDPSEGNTTYPERFRNEQASERDSPREATQTFPS